MEPYHRPPEMLFVTCPHHTVVEASESAWRV